jgi:hypothetical protein
MKEVEAVVAVTQSGIPSSPEAYGGAKIEGE